MGTHGALGGDFRWAPCRRVFPRVTRVPGAIPIICCFVPLHWSSGPNSSVCGTPGMEPRRHVPPSKVPGERRPVCLWTENYQSLPGERYPVLKESHQPPGRRLCPFPHPKHPVDHQLLQISLQTDKCREIRPQHLKALGEDGSDEVWVEPEPGPSVPPTPHCPTPTETLSSGQTPLSCTGQAPCLRGGRVSVIGCYSRNKGSTLRALPDQGEVSTCREACRALPHGEDCLGWVLPLFDLEHDCKASSPSGSSSPHDTVPWPSAAWKVSFPSASVDGTAGHVPPRRGLPGIPQIPEDAAWGRALFARRPLT